MRNLVTWLTLAALLFTSAPGGILATAQAARPANALSACKFSLGLSEARRDIDARCGSLSVPENYADPKGRRLDVQYVVLPALDPKATGLPIFHLEGGPGGSAILNFGAQWFAAYGKIRQNHPVVLIDQRGIGRSASLQCTEIADHAFDDLQTASAPAAEDSVAVSRLQACLQRLSAAHDPQYFTSAAMADDTDAIRAALGYDQILVFGNSYGTWLGQIYLKRHGEHVAGMVLDSVVGPWNKPDLDLVTNGQTALDRLFALCAGDMVCARHFPDLSGLFRAAIARLEKSPAKTTGTGGLTGKPAPVLMTPSRFRQAIFISLYNIANATLVPEMIAEAADGNYLLSSTVLVSQAEQASDFISYGLYYSVTCAESFAFLTSVDFDAAAKESLLFGNPDEVRQQLQSTASACKAWRSAELDPSEVAPVVSDRPVLILSGELDPVTPVRYGEETHARLKNSTLVTFPYQAHAVITNSLCGQTIVNAFLQNPGAAFNSSCVKTDIRPLFAGAFEQKMANFSGAGATFSGPVPDGWKPEQVGPLTFFTSPDSLQFAAAGIYKGQGAKAVEAAALKAIAARYGHVEAEQALTESLLVVSITAVAHSLDRPDQQYIGVLYLRPFFGDTYVVWQAAPATWFQAVSLTIGPAMILGIKPR